MALALDYRNKEADLLTIAKKSKKTRAQLYAEIK
jgi:hypothetical protein